MSYRSPYRRFRSSAAALEDAEDRHSRAVAPKADVEKVTLDLRVVARTNKACCVQADDGGPEVWIPNSQIEELPSCVGGVHQITIPEWLAIDRGLA